MKKSPLLVGAALATSSALGALYFTPGQASKAPAAGAPAASAAAPNEAPSAIAPPTESAAPSVSSPVTEPADPRRKLYESVDALIQASKLEQARKLLDEDAERYGNDLQPEWHDLEQSYRLIADCLEHPSPKLRVRAEAFVLVSQAVSLKPRVLSACSKPTRR